jgi:hypothetical protein
MLHQDSHNLDIVVTNRIEEHPTIVVVGVGFEFFEKASEEIQVTMWGGSLEEAVDERAHVEVGFLESAEKGRDEGVLMGVESSPDGGERRRGGGGRHRESGRESGEWELWESGEGGRVGKRMVVR